MNPLLTVIIPTFNRAPVLSRCLEALARQTCPPELFEVLVADDGSTDDTRRVAAASAGRGVRYLYQCNAGANAARNRAIRDARGNLLLFINDDTIATPPMIAEHLAAHEEYPDDRFAVLGRVTVSPEIAPSRLAALHLDRAFARLDKTRELDWRAFYTCNVSAKKDLLLRGGMFEERIRYHEDLELAERLSHHGLRVIYRPGALAYHEHFLGEGEFFLIAAREARALVAWSRLAPGLRAELAVLGFEPALPAPRRLINRAVGLAINGLTLPFWKWVARRCPSWLEPLSIALYKQLYHSVKRSTMRRELGTSA